MIYLTLGVGIAFGVVAAYLVLRIAFMMAVMRGLRW